MSGCMAMILSRSRKEPIKFSRLLSDSASKEEVVTVFLAMLELMEAGEGLGTAGRQLQDITLYVGRRRGMDDAG